MRYLLSRVAWEDFQEAEASPKAVVLVRRREGTEERWALRKEREKGPLKKTLKFFQITQSSRWHNVKDKRINLLRCLVSTS